MISPHTTRVLLLSLAGALIACAPRFKPGLLVGAGDIAHCNGDEDEMSARFVDSVLTQANTRKQPVAVFTLGDNVYPRGTAEEFAMCYAPTWGRASILSVTHPSPGNHDYLTPGASAYYDYFGERAGPSGRGYYSYSVAGWRVFSLNSELGGDSAAAVAQVAWLQTELAKTSRTRCVLAYWHRPVYSSSRGVNRWMLPIWQALDAAGADVILAGHDHTYERFAKQRADGTPDEARGIRQFIIGTGGAGLYPFTNADSVRNSEVKQNDKQGVMILVLDRRGYSWQFTDIDGQVRDEGRDVCH